jgi:hypothetical protein
VTVPQICRNAKLTDEHDPGTLWIIEQDCCAVPRIIDLAWESFDAPIEALSFDNEPFKVAVTMRNDLPLAQENVVTHRLNTQIALAKFARRENGLDRGEARGPSRDPWQRTP